MSWQYCYSSDITSQVRIKLDYIELIHPHPDPHTNCYYATVQLAIDGQLVGLLQQTTAFLPKNETNNMYEWKQWIMFPMEYRYCTMDTQLNITIFNELMVKVGSTQATLWKKRTGILKTGIKRLIVAMEENTIKNEYEHKLQKYQNGELEKVEWLDKLLLDKIQTLRLEQSNYNMVIVIELPKTKYPIVYHELGFSTSVVQQQERHIIPSLHTILDPEINRENPAEVKHRKLVRTHRSHPSDRDLKPNAKLRDQLNKIMRHSVVHVLTSEEKDLVWRFRFYLSRDRKALKKFVRCIAWDDEAEVKQAVELLENWSRIDPEDALELLSSAFTNKYVRSYAVNQLRRADDDDLKLYLLQLVQALRYEDIETMEMPESPLLNFLLEKAIASPVLGNYFHWYLIVECENSVAGKMFSRVAYKFMSTLTNAPRGFFRRDVLRRQGDLISKLLAIFKELRSMRDPRPRKIEILRSVIADPKNSLCDFAPMPLPLQPEILVTGIIPEKSYVFKSNLAPFGLTFSTTSNIEYPVIFKCGDDLRQDQLIIQIITLMDTLLRKENLDLRLTPYKVLAMGSNHGLLQFISSKSLATILAEYNGSLQGYLREYHPAPDSIETYGINPFVMDTYIRSCAGYSVITYLLGIGDRHLDNLLLCRTGNLFHIDFGFILGRDPKPFPPPMKLCKEMVEAMGGANSAHYQKFKSYCYVAFTILRKSANLIVNLFNLMLDANIPDIAFEPDRSLQKIQEKFRLDLTEEEAIQYFQNLINDSVNALFPQVIETIHKWAQYWRK